MNIFKLLILMVVVASISACSKAPSESDAKKVVLSMLGDCSHISLEHFEKTNGTPITNLHFLLTHLWECMLAIWRGGQSLPRLDMRYIKLLTI
jgi:hypothetical protein